MGARSGTETDTRKFHQALEGQKLEEVFIEEKNDQNFDQIATPWELKWSPLVSRNNSNLSPVVDGNAFVVGYAGLVAGRDMLIGRATGFTLVYTAEETLKYHRLFVGPAALHSVPNLITYNEWRYYVVMTDIYGEITSFEFAYASNNGEAERVALPSPLGWLRLLRAGLQLTITLGRYGVRTLARRPPQVPPGDPAFWEKKFSDYAKLVKSRRVAVGNLHSDVKGVPEANIKVVADREREIHAANRFATRSDWDTVHLGDAAREFYRAPSGKFPDVVARKKNLEFALSEGKGTDMNKVIQQFNAATSKIQAAEKVRAGGKAVSIKITEQEVVVEKLLPTPVHGGTLMSPGPGFGVDKDGFLLDARGFVDLTKGMPDRIVVNGIPIRVITMEYVGGPIHLTHK